MHVACLQHKTLNLLSFYVKTELESRHFAQTLRRWNTSRKCCMGRAVAAPDLLRKPVTTGASSQIRPLDALAYSWSSVCWGKVTLKRVHPG